MKPTILRRKKIEWRKINRAQETIKYTNICTVGVPEEEKDKIWQKTCHNTSKKLKKLQSRKKTQRDSHITVVWLETQREFWKQEKRKYKGLLIKLIADFISETMETRKQAGNTFN